MNGRICGTGSYVPEQIWDNDRLAQMVDTSDAWIRERTGVARRHIAAPEETTACMAAQAAARALDDAQMKAEEIELIIVATISGGEIMPGIACQVQQALGAGNALCFDLNAACTGFLIALNTAQAYLAEGLCQTALVIGAERLSDLVDWTDRSTCILFGDGAGAVVLQPGESGYVQAAHSLGAKGGALTCSSRNQRRFEAAQTLEQTYIRMDGQEVFKFAVSHVPEVIREVQEKAQRTPDEIRYYLLHQANARIVQSVAKRLGEPIEKFPMNMEEYGNTSSASIPLLLDELNRQGKLQRGDRLVLAGFGGGLTYGAAYLQW